MNYNLTVGSVHVPSAMNTISIRGRGKKWKALSMSDVYNYSNSKSISFVDAYKEMCSNLYSNEEK